MITEIVEITVAVFCAFGIFSLFDMLKNLLLFPPKLRKKVRACVYFDTENVECVAAYADYLYREQKISSGRLIILAKNDIMNTEELSTYGDVVYYAEVKGVFDDREREDE